MKTSVFALFLLAVAFSGPALAAKDAKADYRALIAAHCRAVPKDKADWFFYEPRKIPLSTIRIRSVTRRSGGWLRIHAIGAIWSRVIWGYMDYNPRTGQVSCPRGVWEYNPNKPFIVVPGDL